ncbi:hypothetical protein LY78DRAFT_686639 [Colletotrichum sublineola]|nr:hypothetical protein LY78DRAFT_686639 [Colletotrichum sublineola]
MITRVLLVLPHFLAVLCQQNPIDRVQGYADLPGCAASPLSVIVGGTASGCADGGRGTSRDCFCSAASSTVFDAAISSAVISQCGGGAEATAGAARASVVFGEGQRATDDGCDEVNPTDQRHGDSVVPLEANGDTNHHLLHGLRLVRQIAGKDGVEFNVSCYSSFAGHGSFIG